MNTLHRWAIPAYPQLLCRPLKLTLFIWAASIAGLNFKYITCKRINTVDIFFKTILCLQPRLSLMYVICNLFYNLCSLRVVKSVKFCVSSPQFWSPRCLNVVKIVKAKSMQNSTSILGTQLKNIVFSTNFYHLLLRVRRRALI